jgi:ferredoxin-NADP reductase
MNTSALDLVLVHVVDATPTIRTFTLRDPHATLLPPFVPGSHVTVQIGDRSNCYSLTGSGAHPSEYTISVLRRDDGAGGSRALHTLVPGDSVRVSRPRSAFAPVATARRHLLVAAGIGITPMLSHVRAAAAWGRRTTLLYSYRPGFGAHLPDIRALYAHPGSGELFENTTREQFQATLTAQLTGQPVGTHLYVCGPAGFTAGVLGQATDAGWPASRVHSELFAAPDLGPGDPFTVKLARSGTSVRVPAGVTLLEALEGAGTTVSNMCRSGICGECAVPVLRGAPVHRDLYLSDDDKAANDTIMCCVSRGTDHELELDL